MFVLIVLLMISRLVNVKKLRTEKDVQEARGGILSVMVFKKGEKKLCGSLKT